ncbi:hypothetical protein KIW84_021579 [Lathyrus oleraceus]|uniref:DUF7745 domain-containing protein n=1 Tax=Pisum sativum TaxID=3888 RepID=A0A9D5BA37_PEA|nr:hypothetical protein KIW84_021579 [Pisum sativum]
MIPLKVKIPNTSLGQVLTVRDLALALQIKVTNVSSNWKKKGDYCGFWKRFLEKEAERLAGIQNLGVFRNVLSLLIYGLVLFPTYENFINSVAVSVFWVVLTKNVNLVPALLADVMVKEVKLSFIVKAPAHPVIPAPVPISFEEADDMRATISRLTKENEGLLSELNREIGE